MGMSNLLINEVPLMCLPSLAVKVGLNEAIFLQQLHYWVDRSNNIIDGCKWVYNTGTDWAKQFPFWSQKTLLRTISSLEKQKLIITGNYNKKGFDRTKWYTIDYSVLQNLEENQNGKENKNSPPEKNSKNNNSVSDQSIWTKCPNEENKGFETIISENLVTKSFGQNDQMNRTNCPNPSGQNDQIHLDKMASPIPIDYTIDYTETTAENEREKSVLEKFQDNIHPLASKTEADNLIDLIHTYTPQKVFQAIDIANKTGGRSINYIATILKRGDINAKSKRRTIPTSSFDSQYDKGFKTENDKLWDSLPD